MWMFNLDDLTDFSRAAKTWLTHMVGSEIPIVCFFIWKEFIHLVCLLVPDNINICSPVPQRQDIKQRGGGKNRLGSDALAYNTTFIIEYFYCSIIWTSFWRQPMAGLKLVLAEGLPRFAHQTFLLRSKKCDQQTKSVTERQKVWQSDKKCDRQTRRVTDRQNDNPMIIPW